MKTDSNRIVAYLVTLALCFVAFASRAVAEDLAQPKNGSIDLSQCYERTLKRSETIPMSYEAIVQAEEQYKQAWQSIPPKFLFRWQEQYQDASGVESVGQSFFLNRQPQGSFKLSMSPITIYKELSALKSASAFTQQREYEKKRAEHLLYLDVAQVFWNVLEIEDQIKIKESLRDLTKDRVKELTDRERVGRSREAEVVAAQSQLATVEANLEDLRRARAGARELLAFLIGENDDIPLVDTTAIPENPRDLSYYLDLAKRRPDILAAEYAADTAKAAVEVARSGHLPALNVESNYYVKRTGVSEPIKWDVLAAVELPIFSWGKVQSSVRDASSKLKTAELTLKQAQRQTETDVRTAWEDLRASIYQLELYEKSASLAERNYNLQSRDYRRGLVSNLDVLQAMTTLNDAMLQRDQGLYNAKLNSVILQVAVGEINLSEVKP